MRASGPVDWPCVDIMRCMSYAPFRKEWDSNNDFVKFQKKIGANAYVV